MTPQERARVSDAIYDDYGLAPSARSEDDVTRDLDAALARIDAAREREARDAARAAKANDAARERAARAQAKAAIKAQAKAEQANAAARVALVRSVGGLGWAVVKTVLPWAFILGALLTPHIGAQ